VIAGVSACGSPVSKTATSPTSHPSAGTTPTPAPRQLFAVLEARRCKAPEPTACENPSRALEGLKDEAVHDVVCLERSVSDRIPPVVFSERRRKTIAAEVPWTRKPATDALWA
jgi:hypothetical protein